MAVIKFKKACRNCGKYFTPVRDANVYCCYSCGYKFRYRMWKLIDNAKN